MELTVNGLVRSVDAPEGETLLAVLREDLELTGTKPGCEEGARSTEGCGACTVMLGGRAARSCAVAAAEVVGREVTTVEGLSGAGGSLHPVQQAFVDEQVAQCGWCTPAQVVAAVALLAAVPDPTPARVQAHLDAVWCRCGTQPRAVAAVLRAAGASSGVGPR